MSKFDDQIPIDEITSLISMLRGQTPTVPGEVAKSILWIIGSTLNTFDGVAPKPLLMATREPVSDEDAANEIERLMNQPPGVAAGSESSAKALPPWLQALLPILMMLLQQFLTK